MKHIGVLAHSAEGAALCFLTACHEGSRRLGPHRHPDITLSILPMGDSLDLWARSDLPSLRAIFVETARRLCAAGCDFFVCPDNTAHIALEVPGEPLPLPGLHIAEVVAGESKTRNYQTVGVLGTRWTMDGAVYPEAFARRGIGVRVPEAGERAMIDRVIFDELCNGILRDESRREYLQVITNLAEQGCDAVVLGCTEIPLLITPDVSPLPTLDSTRLLATAAVDVAVGARAVPTWRGGPVASQAREIEVVG
jgi:aspartate racemase